MKAPDFTYLRPASLPDAIAMLADHDGAAMPLAGGQSLMPMMNFRVAAPAALVDLADIAELTGITLADGTLEIGAMTRYVTLMHDANVQCAAPLIGLALPHIAHDAIRNRGTIGGSLALADPAAEMPAIACVLDAQIVLAGPDGTRTLPAREFFLGYYETARAPDELIVKVRIPAATAAQRFGFHELTQRHGDYALAGAAAMRDGGTWRAAFFGIADRPLCLDAVDAALAAGHSAKDACAALAEAEIADDAKASAATRRRLAAVALTRAISEMPA